MSDPLVEPGTTPVAATSAVEATPVMPQTPITSDNSVGEKSTETSATGEVNTNLMGNATALAPAGSVAGDAGGAALLPDADPLDADRAALAAAQAAHAADVSALAQTQAAIEQAQAQLAADQAKLANDQAAIDAANAKLAADQASAAPAITSDAAPVTQSAGVQSVLEEIDAFAIHWGDKLGAELRNLVGKAKSLL